MALLCVIVAPVTAQTEPTPTPAPATTWRLLPEPAFMRPDFATPIEKSKATVLTPALIQGDDVRYLTKAEAGRLNVDLESVRRVALANASAELAKLTPEYVRDSHGVALYARLTAETPTVSSVVLAPDFARTFADVLGPDLLVAIPNRYRIYVYPALASKFDQTSELVRRDYELSPYPVSTEVFRITPNGLVAVGKFEEP